MMMKTTMEVGGASCPVEIYRMPHEQSTFITMTYGGRSHRFSVRTVGLAVEVAFLAEYNGRSAWFTIDPDRANDPELLQDHVYDRLVAEHLHTMNVLATA